jgi:hypothetical protein
MGFDQGQGQQGQLAQELFDASVFLNPLFYLRQQFQRDVSSVCFGFDLPSEVMAWVFLAFSTTAIGVATAAEDGDQACCQHWALGLELLLAGLEGAADQRWMFRYVHQFKGRFFQARRYDEYEGLSVTSLKWRFATTFFWRVAAVQTATAERQRKSPTEWKPGNP